MLPSIADVPIHTRLFGYLQDGRPANAVRLQHPDSGLAIEVLEYGATLRTLEVPLAQGSVRNTVLSFDTLADYEADQAYVGVAIGRCANRIANGTAVVADEHIQLTPNEGEHHLHGGPRGFGKVLWHIAKVREGMTPSVLLTHRSPDGENGYPGELAVSMELKITGALSFSISIKASTTRATPFNPTHHAYFNLDGSGCIDEHELCIDADSILQTSNEGLPTGERLAVQSTPFDFRDTARVSEQRAMTHPQLHARGGFDHYFILNKRAACDVQLRGRAGLSLQIRTNQPGIQFYDGTQLDRNNACFAARAGLCIEPHGFPNAVNEPGFPSVILGPQDDYRHITHFTFMREE